MAEEIDSLFVRLGLETDEKEFREADSQFKNLKTTALQMGGALATVGAAGFGLVSNFAGRTDEIGQFAERMDTSAQFVSELGFALASMGGDAEDAFGSIKNMRDLLQDADWGRIEGNLESLSAGIDFEAIRNAESLRDTYLEIAEQIEGLSREDQQRVLDELGFGDAQMNLLMQGPEDVAGLFERGGELAPVTAEMTRNARDFSEAMNELTTQTRGIADILGNRLAPAVTQAINALVGLSGRDDFEQAYEDAIGRVREQFEAIGGLGEGDVGGLLDTMLGNLRDAAGTVPFDLMPGPAGDVLRGMDFGMGSGLFGDTGGGGQTNYVTVDARGSSNPQETEERVRRSVLKTLETVSGRAMEDFGEQRQ